MGALTILGWVFDIATGIALLWLGWRALSAASLSAALVLFVSFGLVLTLAWVRLGAPDVALAEAAIGAGFTGALMLGALARLRTSLQEPEEAGMNRSGQWVLVKPLAAASALAVACGVVIAFTGIVPSFNGLGTQVARNLQISGASNPVTAVLLNFRAYDTLLETSVVLLALIGARNIGPAIDDACTSAPISSVLESLARFLTPIAIIVSGYLLWVGAYAPGGAFQAGAVLAALGVVLVLAGRSGGMTAVAGMPMRLLCVLGPAVFVIVAAATDALQGALLEYPPEYPGLLILLLEAVSTLSIGVTLLSLFAAPPCGKHHGQ